MDKQVKIIGDRIYLRILRKNDASDKYAGWLNDPEVNKFLSTKQVTLKELEDYIEEKFVSDACLFFGIFLKDGDEHIGNVKLEPIDSIKNETTMGIMIGQKKYWGKGIGEEVVNLLFDFAVKKLGIKKMKLGVVSENLAAIRLYEKCGFKIVKVDSQAVNSGGLLHDQVWMEKII
jgi:[ribosomal protein S5]-alanine N-acetyltransferase